MSNEDRLSRLETLLLRQLQQQEDQAQREEKRYEQLLSLLVAGQGKDIDQLKKKALITLL